MSNSTQHIQYMIMHLASKKTITAMSVSGEPLFGGEGKKYKAHKHS